MAGTVNEKGKPLSHTKRLIYAVGLTAVVGGIFIIVSAIVAPEVAVTYVSQHYWVAVFVLSYLVAPLVSRYVRLP